MAASSLAARVLEGDRLPARLADLAEPPARLYLHGELPRGPAVAVVGTRHATQKALAFTRKLAAELATAGVAVLSGGAEGIDTAAHEGALSVGGVTVVVTSAGLDHPFPKKNGALFRQIIAAGGAYLSLVPQHAPAGRGGFFLRNACLMALSHAVVVTQLPVRSGAKNAAKWARHLGRPLFVVPSPPWQWQGRGCVQELRLGARPLDRAKDVLKLLKVSGLHPLAPRPVQQQLPLGVPSALEGMDPVLEALRSGACHADEIAARTGLSLAAVNQRILTLALSGVLVPGPWGSLKLVTS